MCTNKRKIKMNTYRIKGSVKKNIKMLIHFVHGEWTLSNFHSATHTNNHILQSQQ